MVDATAAAVATVVTLAILAEGGLGSPDPGSRTLDELGLVLALASGLPLALCRRWPAGVFVASASATIILMYQGYPLDVPLGPVYAGYVLVLAWGGAGPLRRGVAAAGVVGFAGNEIVARYRITVGRRIGSAALVADGLHARTDGFTSLAVLLSAGGAWLGWQWADPLVGLAITVAITSVLWGAAKEVFARLLDAIDPQLIDRAESTLAATDGVRAVTGVRMRWVGHSLTAEAELDVDHDLTLSQAHTIAHDAEHRLLHALPRLSRALIHAHPHGQHGDAEHDALRHHRTTAALG